MTIFLDYILVTMFDPANPENLKCLLFINYNISEKTFDISTPSRSAMNHTTTTEGTKDFSPPFSVRPESTAPCPPRQSTPVATASPTSKTTKLWRFEGIGIFTLFITIQAS